MPIKKKITTKAIIKQTNKNLDLMVDIGPEIIDAVVVKLEDPAYAAKFAKFITAYAKLFNAMTPVVEAALKTLAA